LLLNLAKSAGLQSGNLSDLANGKMTVQPQDAALINEIQKLTDQNARVGLQENLAQVMSGVEGNMLDRNIAGSTVEAMGKSLAGTQALADLNRQTIASGINNAQSLRQQTLDRAGITLNANQLLLQRLLGGAQGVYQPALQARLAQGTTTGTTTESGITTAEAAGAAANIIRAAR